LYHNYAQSLLHTLELSMDLVPGRSRGEDKVTYLENEVEWTETGHDFSTMSSLLCTIWLDILCTATWTSEEFTVSNYKVPEWSITYKSRKSVHKHFLKAMVMGIVKYSLYFEKEYTVVNTSQ